jgi:predicted Zn-dependent protease
VPSDLTKAREFLEAGDELEALSLVEAFVQAGANDAVTLSLYAYLIASERGQVRRAIELVTPMVAEAQHPDVCLYGARVYLKARRKAQAIACLRAGLALDPQHAGLHAQLDAIGVRKAPLLGFLSRDNVVNRYLGLLARRLHLR